MLEVDKVGYIAVRHNFRQETIIYGAFWSKDEAMRSPYVSPIDVYPAESSLVSEAIDALACGRPWVGKTRGVIRPGFFDRVFYKDNLTASEIEQFYRDLNAAFHRLDLALSSLS